MKRQEAIEIARRCAKAKPRSYYAEPFDPHEWVVDAIMEAYNTDRQPSEVLSGCAVRAAIQSEGQTRK